MTRSTHKTSQGYSLRLPICSPTKHIQGMMWDIDGNVCASVFIACTIVKVRPRHHVPLCNRWSASRRRVSRLWLRRDCGIMSTPVRRLRLFSPSRADVARTGLSAFAAANGSRGGRFGLSHPTLLVYYQRLYLSSFFFHCWTGARDRAARWEGKCKRKIWAFPSDAISILPEIVFVQPFPKENIYITVPRQNAYFQAFSSRREGKCNRMGKVQHGCARR